MNADDTKRVLRAMKACRSLRSFRGADLFEVRHVMTAGHRRWAKRITVRADRRLSRALATA